MDAKSHLLSRLPSELLTLIDQYSLRPGLSYPSCQRIKCPSTGFQAILSACGGEAGNVYFCNDRAIFQYSIGSSNISSWRYNKSTAPLKACPGQEIVLRRTSKGDFMMLQFNFIFAIHMARSPEPTLLKTNLSLPPCYGLVIDKEDNLLLVTENQGILKVSPTGVVTTFFKNPAVRLRGPCFCCLDSAQNLYIADKRSGRIRKITADGKRCITMFAPPHPRPATRTHPSNVELEIYSDLWIDPLGNFFWIADFGTIKMLRSDGQITSMATEQGASALYVDPLGSLYFADLQSETILFLHNNGLATKNILQCFEKGAESTK